MRLVLLDSVRTFSVDLDVGGAVALDDPELWQHDGNGYVKLPAPQKRQSSARWAGVPRVGPAGSVILQLYWNANDPMHDKWRYPATIKVADQAGALLPGRDGHNNPVVLQCDVGREVPGWSHEQEPISILP